MFSKNITKVLLELAKRNESSVKDLIDGTRLSYYQIHRALRFLEKKGLIRRISKTNKYVIDCFLGDLLVELGEKYDLPVVLSKGGFKVATTLLEKPKTAKEISEETGLSYRHTIRILGTLTLSMAVKYERGVYFLVDDPKLKLLLEWLRARRGRIVAGRVLKRVPIGVKEEGSLTGFSVFWRWGVPIQRAFDYYVTPPMKVGLEEAIVHALILAENPQERGLAAIFYAKNIDRVDRSKLQRVAREYGVLKDVLELDVFIRGLKIERPNWFPPWEEVREQARAYSVDLERLRFRPISDEFFERLGAMLEREVRVFLFGGACMVLRGLKDGTKDIDLAVSTKEEYELLVKALKKMGYKSYGVVEVRRRLRSDEPVGVFEKEGFPSIDLYTYRIAGRLVLSEAMMRRAEVKRYGNLVLYLASNEDIILLKSVSDRLRDLLDIEIMIKKLRTSLKWSTILNELEMQKRLTRRHFCFPLLQTVEALEEKMKVKIPIKRKLEYLVEEHMSEVEKEVSNKEQEKLPN